MPELLEGSWGRGFRGLGSGEETACHGHSNACLRASLWGELIYGYASELNLCDVLAKKWGPFNFKLAACFLPAALVRWFCFVRMYHICFCSAVPSRA